MNHFVGVRFRRVTAPCTRCLRGTRLTSYGCRVAIAGATGAEISVPVSTVAHRRHAAADLRYTSYWKQSFLKLLRDHRHCKYRVVPLRRRRFAVGILCTGKYEVSTALALC